MSTECETCGGSGRIEHGEFGGDCAAIQERIECGEVVA